MKDSLISENYIPFNRERVEVIIRHNDKFLLIKSNDPNHPEWRGFPGGGVDGMYLQDACQNECLEEIGIRIKNIEFTGRFASEKHVSGKDNRRNEFTSSRTWWYAADYQEEDLSIMGADGDVRQYEWLTLDEAILALVDGGFHRRHEQIIALILASKMPFEE